MERIERGVHNDGRFVIATAAEIPEAMCRMGRELEQYFNRADICFSDEIVSGSVSFRTGEDGKYVVRWRGSHIPKKEKR